ncbi:site-2 protease family protein [Patescibacteria group bacterium]|nr:site-2 protease family protein [Patescibacteria group bacterium]
MSGAFLNNPLSLLILLVVLIVSVMLHEIAHGFIADRLGDPTARVLGRLTLNPIPHIDLFGSIIVPLLMLLSGTGIIFGWAKPVPFDPFNLRNPRRDSALISLAGPATNMLIAIISAVLLRILFLFHAVLVQNVLTGALAYILYAILVPMITLNVVLAVFNLIPVAPLDGFKIVGGFLPEREAREWYQLERYGLIFLLFLIFPIFGPVSPVSQLISPVINFILKFLIPGTGLV